MTARHREIAADWPVVMRDVGLGARIGADEGESLPTISRPRKMPTGAISFELHPCAGGTIDEVRSRREAIAAGLGALDVEIERITPSLGRVLVFDRPPWPDVIPWRPPREWSLHAPVGVDSAGKTVEIHLGHVPHVLAGGLTGGGKSTFMHSLIGWAACLEGVELWGVDPKRVELPLWGNRFSAVAVEPDEIVDLLHRVSDEMDRRGRLLASEQVGDLDALCRKRGVSWCEDAPWAVLVVDEMADMMLRKKVYPGAAELIERIAAQARSGGIQLVCGTQTPHTNVIPSTLRANLDFRWCGKTEARGQTGTILGDEHQTVPATHIDSPGEAYARTQRGLLHLRTVWLERERIPSLAPLVAGQAPTSSLARLARAC